MQQQERIQAFVEHLSEWFSRNKRTLPWRDMQIEDPNEHAYRILVSEVMLQQTQVERVKIVFKNFLEQFTFLRDLASADNRSIILAWRGMGYNSRALRLRDAARIIVQEHQGNFPREIEELLAIKGIGPYTAAAIRNFAFHLPTAGIDTNIRRVLHRTFIGPENVDGTFTVSDRELLSICQQLIDEWAAQKHRPQDFFAALMDYGSLIQKKTNPLWEICVLSQHGLMMATKENWKPVQKGIAKENIKREPGRLVGSTFIPNRIFRGKVVETLRDAQSPLSIDQIGREICIDWEAKKHKEWLKKLITKLVQDRLVSESKAKYMLS